MIRVHTYPTSAKYENTGIIINAKVSLGATMRTSNAIINANVSLVQGTQ